uniref:Uncharacterized protein n=1 Tax=Anguilla anguilla TaxID=7936 RepID=A0A0E9PWE6_ANGAN
MAAFSGPVIQSGAKHDSDSSKPEDKSRKAFFIGLCWGCFLFLLLWFLHGAVFQTNSQGNRIQCRRPVRSLLV